MSFYVHAIGTAVPSHSISREHALAEACAIECLAPEQQARLEKLYRVTTVERRHSVLLEGPDGAAVRQRFFGQNGATGSTSPSTEARMQRYAADALPLALRAAREALDRSDCDPRTISHLITVSCSGFFAPGLDSKLLPALGLARSTARTHVGFMGCHGALNGLRVAHAFSESNPQARVLVVAIELCSLHYQYGWNVEQQLVNALFADGAAAVVGSAVEKPGAWALRASGSYVVPDSDDAMTWRIGNHGFTMTLSKDVPGLIQGHLRAYLERWLREHDLRLEDIRSWAVHPGGPAILRSVQTALGLQRETLGASHEVLRDYGNMSSPTILFILEQLRADNAPLPCVALGFGPGLVVEAALFACVTGPDAGMSK